MNAYDHIIVGAGSAGCVVAHRLSAVEHLRVLVIEAGADDSNPLLAVPLAAGLFFGKPAMNWGYETEPEAFADHRRISAGSARIVGGGSSINGMVYTRGDWRDFDQWAGLGAEGWSFDEVLPYFRRAETNWRGASEYHGSDGPLSVSRLDGDHIRKRILEMARQQGFDIVADFESGNFQGFGVPDLTVHKGRRGSTSRRFLRPALRQANLTLLTEALVTRLVMDGERVVGVDYVKDGVPRRALAERGVILSAGTFNSPKILMLSGIGRPDDLRAVGVEPLHDLPGVGQNLQEHPGVDIGYHAACPIPFDRLLRLDRLALSMIRWALFKTGPLAGTPVSAMAFLRSKPDLERPDLEWLFTGAQVSTRPWFPGWRRPPPPRLSLVNILLHPESRGSVSLRSADPADAPRIRFNFFEAPNDRETMLRGLRAARAFMASEAAQGLIMEECEPGTDVIGDTDLEAYMRSRAFSSMHASGTCAMGSGSDSVVDSRLKVRGIEGLHVADASVMPTVVGAHTNAAAIMIGERAADFILGHAERRLEPRPVR